MHDSEARSPKQLTDDALDSFILELHDFIIRFPLLNTDEGYDWLYQFVYERLEDYNNGYVNFN